MIMCFISFFLLIWYITLIDLCLLNHPCNIGMSPTWLQFMILFAFIGLIVLCWEFLHPYSKRWLPSWLSGEEPTSHMGDAGSILWYRISPGVGNGNPLPYSCLQHSAEKGAWQAAVQGVTNCWRWLNVHVHKRWWSMIFFFRGVFVWFWYQSDGSLTK